MSSLIHIHLNDKVMLFFDQNNERWIKKGRNKLLLWAYDYKKKKEQSKQ